MAELEPQVLQDLNALAAEFAASPQGQKLADNPTQEQRALAIADRAMFAVLATEAVAHDDFCTVLGLTNDQQQDVARLSEASAALQEAVAWLLERGFVEMAEDPIGQYVNVVRRPGEDD